MKLADALLLRKQLAEKVEVLRPLKAGVDTSLFETRLNRVKVSDEYDDIKVVASRIKPEDITAEWDKYATELRKLDAAIQRTNWDTDLIGFTPSVFNSEGAEKIEKPKATKKK